MPPNPTLTLTLTLILTLTLTLSLTRYNIPPQCRLEMSEHDVKEGKQLLTLTLTLTKP